MKAIWQRLNRKQKSFAIITGVVFAGVLVAALIGWVTGVTGKPDTAKPEAPSIGAGGTAEAEKDPATGGEDGDAPGPDGIEYDGQGMVKMTPTTDPEDFARQAAALMWSTDGGKIKTATEWRTIAIERLTKPTPEYIGPEDQIHTVQDQGQPPSHMPVAEVLERMFERGHSGQNWALLSDPVFYEGIAGLDTVWKATPGKVLDRAEIAEVDSGYGGEPIPFGDFDMTLDKPGASLTDYWVQVEVDETSSSGSQNYQHTFGAGFRVYCAPPEEGGICGAAGMMIIPPAWRAQ